MEKLYEKNETEQQHLKNVSANKQDEFTLWKATKYFRYIQKVNQPIRSEEEPNKDKTELFAKHLKKVFTP